MSIEEEERGRKGGRFNSGGWLYIRGPVGDGVKTEGEYICCHAQGRLI